MTANVMSTIEQRSQTFHESHIAYRLVLIHLQFKSTISALITHTLDCLASRTSFSDTLNHLEKHQIY